jgi:hypothetical protein
LTGRIGPKISSCISRIESVTSKAKTGRNLRLSAAGSPSGLTVSRRAPLPRASSTSDRSRASCFAFTMLV